MATELVIKQDAKLNPQVIDMSPITWEQRREWLKQGLLFTPFWWWAGTMLLVHSWMKDEAISWAMILACLVGLPLIFGLGIACILELITRLERGISRTLYISTGWPFVRAGDERIFWKTIEGWHLAPLDDGSGYQKLTILHRRDSKRSNPHRPFKQWSLIMTDHAQVESLRAVLQQVDQDGKPGARLLLVLPPMPEKPRLSFLGVGSMAVGTTIAIPALLGLLGGWLMLCKKNLIYRSLTPDAAAGNAEQAFVIFMNLFNSTWEIAWLLVIVGLLVTLMGGLMFRFGERALVLKSPT
jgi:hypothetical protein